MRQIRDSIAGLLMFLAGVSFLVLCVIGFAGFVRGAGSFLTAPIGFKPTENDSDWMEPLGLGLGVASIILYGLGRWIAPPDEEAGAPSQGVRAVTSPAQQNLVAVFCAGILATALWGTILWVVWLLAR